MGQDKCFDVANLSIVLKFFIFFETVPGLVQG